MQFHARITMGKMWSGGSPALSLPELLVKQSLLEVTICVSLYYFTNIKFFDFFIKTMTPRTTW
jgi:hypothetical protein